MKMLLSSTALVVALGFPILTLAQTPPSSETSGASQEQMQIPGFMAVRSQSDMLASDLIGHDVHASPKMADMTVGQKGMNADGTHDMVMMNRADLDTMDNIGQINDIVLSSDGQVRALVIGVGSFLGMGERDVAVTMDQVTIASDPDDRSQTYVVVNAGVDMLKDSPAFDRTAATTAAAADNAETPAAAADNAETPAAAVDNAETRAAAVDNAETRAAAVDKAETPAARSTLAAPEIARDGYKRVEITEVSTEMLTGKSVLDVNDNDLGTVTDMIIGDTGVITNVIIDFGGFLGMGSSQASIGYDQLTILSTEGYEDVRIYVDATKEQIRALPQYKAMN